MSISGMIFWHFNTKFWYWNAKCRDSNLKIKNCKWHFNLEFSHLYFMFTIPNFMFRTLKYRLFENRMFKTLKFGIKRSKYCILKSKFCVRTSNSNIFLFLVLKLYIWKLNFSVCNSKIDVLFFTVYVLNSKFVITNQKSITRGKKFAFETQFFAFKSNFV